MKDWEELYRQKRREVDRVRAQAYVMLNTLTIAHKQTALKLEQTAETLNEIIEIAVTVALDPESTKEETALMTEIMSKFPKVEEQEDLIEKLEQIPVNKGR